MIRRTLLTLTAVVVCLLAVTSPAGATTRTFTAYDLTQCSCTVNAYNQYEFVKSAPTVTVSSYMDTSSTATTVIYQRVYSVNNYMLAGYYDGHEIQATNGEPLYVLCYTNDSTGRAYDKVAGSVKVNGTYRLSIFYALDTYVAAYVVDGHHHC